MVLQQGEQEHRLVGVADSEISRDESTAVVASSGDRLGRGVGGSVARLLRVRRVYCPVSPEQGSRGVSSMQPNRGVGSRVADAGVAVVSALTRIIGKAGRVSTSSSNSPNQRIKSARYEAGGDIENDVNESRSNGALLTNNEKYIEDTEMEDDTTI